MSVANPHAGLAMNRSTEPRETVRADFHRIQHPRAQGSADTTAAADNETLRAENARLSQEAAAARSAAEVASRSKSQFLAVISHEIRTPINAVLGYADLLEMETDGPVNHAQHAHLDRIRACAIHLEDLVTDILDLSRVESGQIHIDPVESSVGDALATAFALAFPLAQQNGIAIAQDADWPTATYIGDPARVRQILFNLLSNAIKFTPRAGRITLQHGATSEHPTIRHAPPSGWMTISVRDTGIGIAESQLTAVFEPFVQGDMGHTRLHGGTGLGLTISRRYAHAMGGDITVVSRRGVGSTFTLWLPAGDVKADETA